MKDNDTFPCVGLTNGGQVAGQRTVDSGQDQGSGMRWKGGWTRDQGRRDSGPGPAFLVSCIQGISP
jgi:hypothetical protein